MAAFMSHRGDWLERHADEWVHAGLVSSDQADAIRAFEGTAESAVRLPIVAEVAAYLGSVLALMAGSIVVGQRWDDLTVYGRTVLGLAIAVVGLIGGSWLVHLGEPGTQRLGGFLWALGAGGIGLVGAVLGEDRGLTGDDGRLLLVIGIPVFAIGLALWRNLDRPLQFLTAVAGAGITFGGIGQWLEFESWQAGVALWGAGVLFALLVLSVRVEPQTITLATASFVAWFGAMVLIDSSERWGAALAALTAGAAVVAAIRERIVPALVVGVITFLIAIQALLQTTFSGAGSSLVVAVIGLAIVVAAVFRARPNAH